VEYEDRVTIVTPEGVSVDLTLAGIGSRGVAAILDGLIKGIIFIATIAALFGGLSVFDTSTTGSRDPSSALLIGLAVGAVIIFVINFFYDVAFETLSSGRTPGKRVAGIRVVKEGGAPVRFTSSAIRNIVRIVDALPSAYLVGLISIAVSSKNQRLGDMAAGTLVVRERKEELPIWNRPVPVSPATEAWDVTSITPDELTTVRKFLERRYTLTSEARSRLAWELSERLRQKVPGVAANLEAEEFLEQVAATKAAKS
jgi:uncharacterized RDD family membrane protein YckC